MSAKIKVLIVDDSAFFRKALAAALRSDLSLEIAGEASDPYEAKDKIMALKPDVMILDVEMPLMNGVDFLKILLPQWSMPVLVVSSARQFAMAALRAGATDFIPKPDGGTPDCFAKFTAGLIQRIKMAASCNGVAQYIHGIKSVPQPAVSSTATFQSNIVVAMGASTGGTQSTAKILRALPANFPGIVIVQHMPPDFTRMYAENLNQDCALSVREAQDGDVLEQGLALIAPGDKHMELLARPMGGYMVRCRKGEKVSGHCPSVDVLFLSVARAAGARAVGVIMTGMGADGAQGLLAMRSRGAYTIGQDEKSCVVYGMPKEAYAMGAVVHQMPLKDIAAQLIVRLKQGSHAT